MTDENLTPPSVSEMLRITSENQKLFLTQIAEHIDKLEQEVLQLRQRVADLEREINPVESK